MQHKNRAVLGCEYGSDTFTADLVANRFNPGRDDGVDIPLGLRFNKMFRFDHGGAFIVPEVRAAYVYSAEIQRLSREGGFFREYKCGMASRVCFFQRFIPVG